MRPVVAALGQLFAGVAAAQGGQPAKKRELDDSSKRLGVLFWCAPGFRACNVHDLLKLASGQTQIP
jgi:hypothetical protein